ncbi:MAG: SigE family RNA polymerase sigma factor [Micrococcales bacterium]|nr:SigE family RNA polymerase sigma factor [Micrococcales bacterium]
MSVSEVSWAVEAGQRVDVATGTRDEEFTMFMTTAMPALSRTAWHLTGDEHRAADLVQQTLVRTYTAWPRARRAPLPYARKIMANQRVSTWRSRRREVLTDGPPDQVRPDESAALAERDLLMRALARLGAQQRRVVVLRHVEGFSEKEVAAMLNVSVGTVKSAASRGLQHLREALKEEQR